MTSWDDLERLFHEALDLPESERADFLRRATDDEALRHEVSEMLRADQQGPLNPPSLETMHALSEKPPTEERKGLRLGDYVLGEAIGHGGMGAVYEAKRAGEDFEQEVAIKFPRSGWVPSAEIIARFRLERRTLAGLEHPGIARFLDGGTTPEGEPYFVLERVHGEPIDEYCDNEGLGIAERVDLMRKVCAAVSYAHAHLVVHRDLKPANILVDDIGEPKLLDFGIAKVQGESADALETKTGEWRLTPEYASPEQLRGLEPVTVQSDVYSLGVLLYELLTGERPHQRGDSAPHEAARRVLEDPPRKPSTVLRTAEPPQAPGVWRGLQGDLDNVLLMALAKEPDRRYASVAEFSEDLERALDGRPVRARPATLAYRASKFVGRNRMACALGALVGVLSVLAVASFVRSERAARLRAQNLLELSRLSDLRSLDEYIAEADELFPSVPAMIPGMQAWLARAQELAQELPEHRASLEAMRVDALPRTEEDKERDRQRHPLLPRSAALAIQLEASDYRRENPALWGPRWEEARKGIEQEMADVEAQIEAARSYRFRDAGTQHAHDQLTHLVERLETFTQGGTVALVETRLEFARSLATRNATEPAEVWEASIQLAAREDGPYGGQKLVPQLGLVPLGPDPGSGLLEFSHLESGEAPLRDDEGELHMGEESSLVFVLLPGNSKFLMGSGGEDGRRPDPYARPAEQPLHEVALDPFFLSKYEMSQGQWLRTMGENPSKFRPGERHGVLPTTLLMPVEMVSFEMASRCVERLGLQLPTEAQWEYAARAGSDDPWWTGADPLSLEGAANLADNYAREMGAPWPPVNLDPVPWEDQFIATAPIGYYRANAFGLHDVHGNVWEWTSDDFSNYILPTRPGSGARVYAGGPNVVGRGGSFIDLPPSLRSGHRGPGPRNVLDKNLGLRPARPLQAL